ncbi:MAG: hypothetical protein ACRETX_17700, partial [Steroidobacteraceae bacterium]
MFCAASHHRDLREDYMSWQSRKRWVFASAVVYLSAAMGACKEPAPAAVTLHGAHGAATVSSAK